MMEIRLLLDMEDPENSDLYLSHFKKGRWSKVEPLRKEINSKWNETNGSFSADGKTLYFTSNRKGGEGDLDIYRSILQGEVWSVPQNLGPEVNTPYNEETPFVSADNKELYFSSEGHNGMGGYDVFKYDLSNPGSEVVNLGYPVNTTENNLFYVPFGDGSTAYYAFRGEDTYGGRDIYRVTVIPDVVEETMVAAAAEPEAPVAEKVAAVTAGEPETASPRKRYPRQRYPCKRHPAVICMSLLAVAPEAVAIASGAALCPNLQLFPKPSRLFPNLQQLFLKPSRLHQGRWQLFPKPSRLPRVCSCS